MNIKKIYKENKPLLFIIIFLFIGVIGGTIAFLYNQVTYSNKFKAATNDVFIDEEFYGDFGTKKVEFVNKGSSDVIIRINYNEVWQKKVDDEVITLNNMINNYNLVEKNWTAEFLNDFTYHDGWYYYNKLLKGNSRVQVLTSISLNNDLIKESIYKDEYLNADYELDFNLETVQADSKAVNSIWGFSPTIEEDNIIWNF